MKKRSKLLTVLFAAVLTAAMLLSGCGKQKNVMKKYEGKLAVTIDDRKVMLTDMMYQLFGSEINGSYYDSMYQNYYGMSFWDMDQDGKPMREVIKEQAMDNAVMYVIMAMEAEKAGITLTDEEVAEYQAQIDELINQDDAEAIKTIEYIGFTKENLDNEFKMMTLAMKYYDQLEPDFNVSEEEIRSVLNYEDYREYITDYLYLPTSSYDSQYNLIEQTDEEKAAGRVVMDEALEMAQNGDAFADIAAALKEKAEMTASSRTFTKDSQTVDPAYIEAALALAADGLSGVVETESGLYLIRMTNDNSDAGYETAVQEAVDKALNEAFAAKYEEIKATHTIQVNNQVWDELKFGEITIEPTQAAATSAAK